MIVSCICPTYGRFPLFGHLLEEAVESFLRQRIPDGVTAELVILNDAPEQRLYCVAIGTRRLIRCVNLASRLPTLGDKYNAMVEIAVGNLILPWEDDDISLPSRIEQAVVLTPQGGYFNPQASWFLNGGKLHRDHGHGVCHNASAYSRSAWEAAGRYPAVIGSQDAGFDRWLKRAIGVSLGRCNLTPPEWQYIYRWGVSHNHLSGVTDMVGLWGEQRATPGTYTINPRWARDYAKLVDSALSGERPKLWMPETKTEDCMRAASAV